MSRFFNFQFFVYHMSEEHQKSIRIRRRASGLLLSKHLPDHLLNSGGPPRVLHNPAGGAHVVCHIGPALSTDQVTIPEVEYLNGWIHFFHAHRDSGTFGVAAAGVLISAC